MKNLFTPCQAGHKWISFTNDGSWMRAVYSAAEDAMTIKLKEVQSDLAVKV